MPNAPPTSRAGRHAAPTPYPPLRVRAVTSRRAAPREQPLNRPLTIGAAASCDCVVKGAGIRDHHARIEPGDRGPSLVLTPGAAARVNGSEVTGTLGVMPGDEIEFGPARLTLWLDGDVERHEWRLLSSDERASLLIAQPVDIGRDEDCQLRLSEPEIAARHARLLPVGGLLWVQDTSDGGTRLGGERVRGARLARPGDRLQVGNAEFRVAAERLAAVEPDMQQDDELAAGVEHAWPETDRYEAAPDPRSRESGHPPHRPLPSPTRRHGRGRRRRRGTTAAESPERTARGWHAGVTIVALLASFAAGLAAGLTVDRDDLQARLQSIAAHFDVDVPEWLGVRRGGGRPASSEPEPATRTELPGVDTEAAVPQPRLSNTDETAAPTDDPPEPAEAPDEGTVAPDPAVARLLDDARARLAAGQLAAPRGANAIEVLATVLLRDPANLEARQLINEAADTQLTRARQRLADQDYAAAAGLLREMHAIGSDAGVFTSWIDPELERELGVLSLIVEADRYLHQSNTATLGAPDPGSRLRETVAAHADAELTPRVIADIGDILAVAAREARWAGRDAEAQHLQDLQQRLSAHARPEHAG